MELELTVVAANSRRDVTMELGDGTSVGQLCVALGAPEGPGLWIGDKFVSAGNTITTAGLRSGAVVGLDAALPCPPAAVGGPVAVAAVGGLAAGAVYGAWRETIDRLGEIGAPPTQGRSTAEVARAAPPRVHDDVRALGALLARAGYAPESAAENDARTAWSHADAVIRRLRSTMSPVRRVLAALDPRPLWRR